MRMADLAVLSRDTLQFLAGAVRFKYFGTKELRVPRFTAARGLPKSTSAKVCPVTALKDYVERTSGSAYHTRDPHGRPFDHVFMALAPVYTAGTAVFKPVGSQTCSRWLKNVMDWSGVDVSIWKGGSVRMAGSSKALDEGHSIDVVMHIGRWSSWKVFQRFYNRSQLSQSAPLVGETTMA